ncbi:MAG: hypothetical protein IJ876_05790 [Elusimicrobiaceae bacterium]|nr:hypothetical protein [Elusimicrobiaceae bacterium]
MKIQLFFVFVCAVILAGCTALQNPSHKNTQVLTDFSNPAANQAYYEFTSSPLDKPSVLTEQAEEPAASAEEASDDEDFTAENIASAYGTYGDVVVTVASHKFTLGENASRQDMTRFQKALDNGYLTALRQYRPIGFTYAMSSMGAINPLSDIEVTCKLSERSANQVGQDTCRTFFNTVARQYAQSSKGTK